MVPPLKLLRSIGKEHRYLLIVSLMVFFYITGNGGVWFALPLMAESLTKDLMLVGILIAIPNFVSLFLDIPVGGLSDYLGRKKLMALGLIMMFAIGLMLPKITSIIGFIFFMIFFGIANQFIFIAGRAFLMDISPKGKTSEYFGVFEALGQIGFAIGPVIAGIIIADNLNTGVVNLGLFYLLTCLTALIFVLLLKETINLQKLSKTKDLILKDRLVFRELLDFKEFKATGLIILTITFVIVVADGLIWTMEPLYKTLGLDYETLGIILSMFVIPYILFDIPAGILADKIGKTKIITIGLLLAGASLIVFGYSIEPIMLLISAFLAATGLACVRPSVGGLLTDLAEKKQKGGIVGVWDISEDLGYVIGPILGGIISQYYSNVGMAFIVMGGLLLLLVPITLLVSKRNSVYTHV